MVQDVGAASSRATTPDPSLLEVADAGRADDNMGIPAQIPSGEFAARLMRGSRIDTIEEIQLEPALDEDCCFGSDSAAYALRRFCQERGGDARMIRIFVDVLLNLEPVLEPPQLFGCLVAFVPRIAPVALMSTAGETLMNLCTLFQTLLLFHDPEVALLFGKARLGAELYCAPWFLTAHASGMADQRGVLQIWEAWIDAGDALDVVFFGLARILTCRNELLLCGPVAELAQVLHKVLASVQHSRPPLLGSIIARAANLRALTPLTFLRTLQHALLCPTQVTVTTEASEKQATMQSASSKDPVNLAIAASDAQPIAEPVAFSDLATSVESTMAATSPVPLSEQPLGEAREPTSVVASSEMAGHASAPASSSSSASAASQATSPQCVSGSSTARISRKADEAGFAARAAAWWSSSDKPTDAAKSACLDTASATAATNASAQTANANLPTIKCMRVEAQDVMMAETIRERHLKKSPTDGIAASGRGETRAKAHGLSASDNAAVDGVRSDSHGVAVTPSTTEDDGSVDVGSDANLRHKAALGCRLLPTIVDIRSSNQARRVRDAICFDVLSSCSPKDFVVWANKREEETLPFDLRPLHVLMTANGTFGSAHQCFLRDVLERGVRSVCILSGGYEGLKPHFIGVTGGDRMIAERALEAKQALQKGLGNLNALWKRGAPARQHLLERVSTKVVTGSGYVGGRGNGDTIKEGVFERTPLPSSLSSLALQRPVPGDGASSKASTDGMRAADRSVAAESQVAPAASSTVAESATAPGDIPTSFASVSAPSGESSCVAVAVTSTCSAGPNASTSESLVRGAVDSACEDADGRGSKLTMVADSSPFA
eukprot:TRINITY_DN38483_c0_g1_i1.p1 TRINITY_DN38483_c0_g1~~TRINITY_DN38483_c0_g1_i1.p1  ORF type:complete len:836 (-),score=113.25 TRINITY_DN38483_c0_g1_i1:75-2582(-)